jgi:hypothetical protein
VEPSPGDQTAAGSQTLRAERTKLGSSRARHREGPEAVAFVQAALDLLPRGRLRRRFRGLQRPGQVHDPAGFQRAAEKIGYTFNWFYADADHIAYFNSGANPVRAKGIDHDFPVRGALRVAWLEPDAWSARFTPFAQHRRSTDQRYLISWNNKQARGYALLRRERVQLDVSLRAARGPRRRRRSPARASRRCRG